MKKWIILLLVLTVPVLHGDKRATPSPAAGAAQSSMLHRAMQKLEQAKIPKDHEAVLILKRLDHYLKEIQKGNSYFTWQSKKTRPVYNFLSFARMTDHRVIDTIVLEPDNGTFSLTWRASVPLQKNIFEIVQVLAGHMQRGWWRARELGKDYYPSLGELISTRKREAEKEEAEA